MKKGKAKTMKRPTATKQRTEESLVFTTLWSIFHGARSARAIAKHRDFPKHLVHPTLSNLRKRGLVKGKSGALALTRAGKKFVMHAPRFGGRGHTGWYVEQPTLAEERILGDAVRKVVDSICDRLDDPVRRTVVWKFAEGHIGYQFALAFASRHMKDAKATAEAEKRAASRKAAAKPKSFSSKNRGA